MDKLGANDSEGELDGNIESVSVGVGAEDSDGNGEGKPEGNELGAAETVGRLDGRLEGETVGGSVFKIQRFERYSESSSSVRA